ncbi:MAG TPA: AsmA-like C-terminal region-containing protein, partial [Chitinophagaceae bacterium]|nr:AsmA-like C-terminal region-containing protein [Chitinophagaceae bacterium]
MIKKVFKIAGVILIILLIIAFAVPILFKDKIVAKVKSAINKNLNAKVAFADVDISLFRHFPRVSLEMNSLQVTGINQFERDTLLAANNLDVALDLISVIRGSDMTVYSIAVDSPRVHAIIDSSGRSNWDITKSDSLAADSSTGEKEFRVELKNYRINNGHLVYHDRKGSIRSEITNINHEGSGDFTADNFILNTNTTADAVDFTMNGIPYLADVKTDIKADIQVDNKTDTYRFETNRIVLNGLQLATKGFLQLVNDSTYNMDVSFNAPSNSFKSFLSLIPVIYKHDFEKVNAGGNAVFKGFVRGTYGPTQIPAYNLNLGISNAFFQYADLPRPVKNINLTLEVNNPDGITDHAVINIPRAHLEMDNEPFDFRLLLKNPVSDMLIDAAAKGKLDLTKITQFVKLETGTKLSGILQANVTARGAMSAIEQQRYEQFNAAGTIAVSGLQYASSDYPDGVKVNNLFMTFNPRDVSISDLDGQYKKTNFTANGTVSNFLPYMLRNKTLDGTLQFKADNVNLNEWMGTSTDSATANTPAAEPFKVPANLNLAVQADVNRVMYDKLELQRLSGSMAIKDERVTLRNIQGDALDGTMKIDGSYSTRDSKKKPDISLNYDVKGLDVQKTFFAFNTVQKLMPIGRYLDGKLSSQLTMTGKLGDNMMPDLSSLTGEGNLLLIEGFLRKFAPLEKLADLLNVKELKELTVRDVKNYVEFRQGMVRVKPFTVKVKDIEMEVGGNHGLNQSLDY